MSCGATTLTKHVAEVRHVIWMNKIQNVRRIGKILISKIWWWMVDVFEWRCIVLEERCVVINVNKQRLGDGNCSNPGGRFGKPGGGREIRGGGDGLYGPSGQLSMCVLLLEMDFDGACGGERDFFL
ncbi:hypothetical protein Tco_1566828, partial [Tanacetum coccineum]